MPSLRKERKQLGEATPLGKKLDNVAELEFLSLLTMICSSASSYVCSYFKYSVTQKFTV